MYWPPGGNLYTQDLSKTFDIQPLRIDLKGSSRFSSNSNMSYLADKIPIEYAKLRGENIALKGQLQSTRQIAAKRLTELNKFEPVKKFAQESGLPVQKVVASLIGWAKLTKSTDDYLRRIQSAYILGKTDEVIRLAEENDPNVEKALDISSRKYFAQIREYISNKMFKGSGYINKGDYRKAIKSLNEAYEKDFWKGPFAKEFADIDFLLAGAKYKLGLQVEGEEGPKLLVESVEFYRKFQAYYKRENFPYEWAIAQSNVGAVFGSTGLRLAGEKSREVLKNAEEATNLALEVQNQQCCLDEWAGTQTNLGVLIKNLGVRLEGENQIKALRNSENIFRSVLQVITRQTSGPQWANAKHNLANVLTEIAERSDGEDSIKMLREAERAYLSALEVYTRQSYPEDWAQTQNNLAVLMKNLALRLEGEDRIKALRESEKAFRSVLQTINRQTSAEQWAMTQNNFGNVLRSLGESTDDKESLKVLQESKEAYLSALKVYTRQSYPEDWAQTQNNLAVLMKNLALRLEGEDRIKALRESEKAFRSVLQTINRQTSAEQWAMTQNNFGNVLGSLGESIDDKESLKVLQESKEAYLSALEVYTRQSYPLRWAITQINLGIVLKSLGIKLDCENQIMILHDSLKAFRSALEVLNSQEYPHYWIGIETNLAHLYFILKDEKEAEAIYNELLKYSQDDKDVYHELIVLYHETIFDFPRAYDLQRRWLEKHPQELDAQANYSEALLTTRHFIECSNLINSLLVKSKISASSNIALRGIEIASLLALGDEKKINEKLEALIAKVLKEPKEFKVDWSFNGTKNYIEQSKELANYKDWLERLFDAINAPDRDAILVALKKVKEEFKK